MDINDVSTVPEYLQILQKQKAALQRAQAFQGQPYKEILPRDEAITLFNIQHVRGGFTPGRFQIRTTFIPPAYPPCIVALCDLQKAMIKSLTLGTHHRGSYLLLRTVTEVQVITGANVIVEDEEGTVVILALYNQENNDFVKPRVVKGTVIILKEPYLRVTANGDYGIRVDHVSDIMFTSEHDSRIPPLWRQPPGEELSADSWKVKGNEFFHRFSYHSAIDFYNKALDSSPTAEEAVTIKLNRALAFLKSHQYDAALRDIEGMSSEKALYHKTQTLYYLQRFEECCEVHTRLSKEYSSDQGKTEFSRALRRLAEQRNGKYDFKQMQLEAKGQTPPILDHATYVGPVSVRSTGSRGRGLFTTKPVQAGDLLFCEKAFTFALCETDNSGSPTLLINVETGQMTMSNQGDVIESAIQKVFKNPSLRSTFTDLYHGSYQAVDVAAVDGMPVVDSFLAERITALNGFGCPLSSRGSHIKRARLAVQQADSAKKKFYSTGIWPLASYVNHSCSKNAVRSFIGDMMIVRAIQDLDADTEITFWYTPPATIADKPMDLKHWGFKCSCVICQDSLDTPASKLVKRKALIDSMAKKSTSRNPAKAEVAVSALQETYLRPPSDVPRLAVCDASLTLVYTYVVRGQQHKVIEYALKALESLGYVIEGAGLPYKQGTQIVVKKWGQMIEPLVPCWMMLCRAYGRLAPELAGQAEKYAKIAYKMCIGEDDTFEETYSKLTIRPDSLFFSSV